MSNRIKGKKTREFIHTELTVSIGLIVNIVATRLTSGKYSVTYNVTSNESIAGNGQIREKSDTSEYIKE